MSPTPGISIAGSSCPPPEPARGAIPSVSDCTGFAAENRFSHQRGNGNQQKEGDHLASYLGFAKIGPERAGIEIGESKRRLEAITAAPVTLFAYPNGRPGRDYGREHVAMVKELGFEAAVSTAWGVSRAGSDLFQLPRFTPWDKTPGRFVLRLVQNTFRTSPECI